MKIYGEPFYYEHRDRIFERFMIALEANLQLKKVELTGEEREMLQTFFDEIIDPHTEGRYERE